MTTMINDFLDIFLDANRVPSPEMVEQLNNAYPYFWIPSAVMLQRCGAALENDRAETLRSRIALNSSDHTALFRLTTELGSRLGDMKPKPVTAPATPSTTDAIDTFLDRYGSIDPAEEAMLERLIFNPTPSDYSLQFDNEGGEGDSLPDQATDDSLESIIAAVKNIASMPPEPNVEPTHKPTHTNTPAKPQNPAPDSTFSESLAKIYIKQQRFDKALEIISGLNLKFPEKSVYFADQIRFLQKLILNRSYNSQQ